MGWDTGTGQHQSPCHTTTPFRDTPIQAAATPALPVAVNAASPSMLIQMPTHYMKPSAAVTTNHPAATTSPLVNTSARIPIVAALSFRASDLHTVILSEAKDLSVVSTIVLSFRASTASRGICFIAHTVMADPIVHLQASSLHPSSHHHPQTTTL